MKRTRHQAVVSSVVGHHRAVNDVVVGLPGEAFHSLLRTRIPQQLKRWHLAVAGAKVIGNTALMFAAQWDGMQLCQSKHRDGQNKNPGNKVCMPARIEEVVLSFLERRPLFIAGGLVRAGEPIIQQEFLPRHVSQRNILHARHGVTTRSFTSEAWPNRTALPIT